MKPIDIFITSWRRPHMTEEVIRSIHDRTAPGTFKITVLDNECTPVTRSLLSNLMDEGLVEAVISHKTNTRCLWGKYVFHAMVDSSNPYYVVTDNDVIPPRLEGKDWLARMVELMNKHQDVAFLTPQLPPQWLQMPTQASEDLVYCKAVGNTFKMVRREAYPVEGYPQSMDAFGDDGLVSQLVREKSYKVAFCRDMYCLHKGQTKNWGYSEEDIKDDPRKAGYGEPYTYEITDMDTFVPVDPKLRM